MLTQKRKELFNYSATYTEDAENKEILQTVKTQFNNNGKKLITDISSSYFNTDSSFMPTNAKKIRNQLIKAGQRPGSVQAIKFFVELITNDGFIRMSDGSKVKVTLEDVRKGRIPRVVKDALGDFDYPGLLGETIKHVILLSQDPTFVGEGLLKNVDIGENTLLENTYLNVSFTPDRVARGQEYPSGSLSNASDIFSDANDFVGCVYHYDPNLLNSFSATLNILQYISTEAVKSIGRFKEAEIMNMFTSIGSFNTDCIVFDNYTAGYRVTSGRSRSGALNGTMTINDIIDMMNALILDGYNPDTLLIHPSMWMMWAKDPFMKIVDFNSGNAFVQKPAQGNTGFAGEYSATFNLGEAFDPTPLQTTYTDTPNMFMQKPLRIIVSPYLTVNTITGRGSVIVADSAYMGLIAHRVAMTTDGWSDIEHDTTALRWREKYGLLHVLKGEGIRIANGVVYDQESYYYGPENMQQQFTGTLEAAGTGTV